METYGSHFARSLTLEHSRALALGDWPTLALSPRSMSTLGMLGEQMVTQTPQMCVSNVSSQGKAKS